MKILTSLFNIKCLIALVVIILLSGLLSLFSYNEVMGEPTQYTYSNTIKLLNIEDEKFSDINYVRDYITSYSFLEEVETLDGLTTEIEDLLGSLSVISNFPGTVTISISTYYPEEVFSDLEKITIKFVEESNQAYSERIQLIENTITRLQEQSISPEQAYDYERFIYELELQKLRYEEAMVTDPINVTEVKQSPINEAITTFILSFAILLFVLIAIYILTNVKVTKRENSTE